MRRPLTDGQLLKRDTAKTGRVIEGVKRLTFLANARMVEQFYGITGDGPCVPERKPLDKVAKAALALVLRAQRLPLAEGVLMDDVYPLLTALEGALIDIGITGDGQ